MLSSEPRRSARLTRKRQASSGSWRKTASAISSSDTQPCTPSRPVVSRSEDTRLNSSHDQISYAVFCLKKKNKHQQPTTDLQSRSNTLFRLLLDDTNSTQRPAHRRHAYRHAAETVALARHQIQNTPRCGHERTKMT